MFPNDRCVRVSRRVEPVDDYFFDQNLILVSQKFKTRKLLFENNIYCVLRKAKLSGLGML